MKLPARRTARAVVHAGVTTGLTAGLAAIIVGVFGLAGWVADLLVVGVIAIVVTIVAAYILSRP